jgi:predicted regulator of Ras-like GTPase activity (Roadblock/LC7/MglB family)
MARWLETLEAMPHVLTAVLVSDDGLEIESVGGAQIGTLALAAETASLVRSSAVAGKNLGGGKLFRWSFTTDNFEVISIRVGLFHSLTVAVQRGADARGLQVEMARMALKLVPQLEPQS